MRYQAFDLFTRAAESFHDVYASVHSVTDHPLNPYRKTIAGKLTNASLESAMRLTKRYDKVGFQIDSVVINGKDVAVDESVVYSKPFCDLVCFKSAKKNAESKVLLIAPLSGHHSTLLKGTVEGLLINHDVYITDWLCAREVPLEAGPFDIDSYVSYLIEFMEFLGENSHMIAICQPTVQALIATAVMAEENNPCTPNSLILMAGPIDPSISPTRVNDYAREHSIDWFKNFAIMTVPMGYPGSGRHVYPGFLQLGGFLSMNLKTHLKKFGMFFQNLVTGEEEDADRYRAFYDEYLSVLDMPADFYLETIEKIFQNNELATGKITYKGNPVNLAAINKTALLTVEGANDDICGAGQTEAAHALCSNVPDEKRKHHVQEGAGHYGVFSGSKFRGTIRPLITSFIDQYS